MLFANLNSYLNFYLEDENENYFNLVKNNKEESFQFFQDNKTMKYNNKFINLSEDEYNKLLFICCKNTM